jgi:serine/threonine-protein kinase
MRFEYELPEGQQLSTTASPLAISPDGKILVYSTSNGLYLRSVDELAGKLIPGTEGSSQQPFFSPDGKWIGYFSGGQLKKISINGGAPVTLCGVPQIRGAWWSSDDTIVYGQYPPTGPIMRVSANGGSPEPIIKQKAGPLMFPQILPDGESVLYTEYISLTQAKIMVHPLKSGEPKELFAGQFARYLPTGHIVYGLANNLFAIPFNLDKLETSGGPVPVVESIDFSAVSDSGTLIYIPRMASATPSGAAAAGCTLVCELSASLHGCSSSAVWSLGLCGDFRFLPTSAEEAPVSG